MDARTVLLTPEEAIHYELHLRRLSDELRPFGHRENELVQSLAEAQWLLARIPSLEMEIYTAGRIQFAGQSQNCEPREADALIDVRTYFAHQRQLNKLNKEEARLRGSSSSPPVREVHQGAEANPANRSRNHTYGQNHSAIKRPQVAVCRERLRILHSRSRHSGRTPRTGPRPRPPSGSSLKNTRPPVVGYRQ
ncbi:MAG: hypothetical protein JWP08_322 [Bryobacterales bacterium]|nr:hypothetical protein [Bryobacterales bacterium]